ncbi:HAMP domain-containing protein [Paenibacillus sp. FJAT-27812]|uniref:HAMP domain-containing protein n=1 Tax=Paenibacillus sp. FJAT-27812 TaxID=1684143 RepID=UPI0006A75BDF|nr:HAMP domain-containing protein [Paenibacillus sp. FJAT-27812]
MTIRLRLTLFYAGILAAALLVFCIALYSFLQFYIFIDLKSSLKEQTETFQEYVKYKLKIDPTGWHLLVQVDDFDTVQSGMYVQVINLMNGNKMRSRNLGNAELPYSHTNLEERKQGYFVTAKIENSLFIIYNDPLMVEGNVIGVLQTAYHIGVINKFFTILRWLLFSLSLFIVAIASYIGWLSAKQSLKPIYSLIEETKQIQSSEDLGKRVRFHHKGDEVSLLGTTINGMLERIQTMYAELDRSFLNQRRFVADASHELKSGCESTNKERAL